MYVNCHGDATATQYVPYVVKDPKTPADLEGRVCVALPNQEIRNVSANELGGMCILKQTP